MGLDQRRFRGGNDRRGVTRAGKGVSNKGVPVVVAAAKVGRETAGLTLEDSAGVIPHQANVRSIGAVAVRLKISVAKFFVNLDKYGNTSAAAVAIALDEANRRGRINRGASVLLVPCGGGPTWAGPVSGW